MEVATEINNTSVVTETVNPTQLQSSLARAIAKVVGTTNQVRKFDNLHIQMKNTKYSKSTHSEHNLVLAELQRMVLQQRTAKLDKLTKMEKVA